MKLRTPFHGFVSVKGKNLKQAVASTIFRQWISNLDPGFVLHSIDFQSVDIITKKGKPHVLFIKMKAEIEDGSGNKLPGIIFLRGAAVAIFIVLECKGKKYVVLVEGAMPSIGRMKYAQLPAGMMDDERDPVDVAVREMEEETGMKASYIEFESLTALTYGNDLASGGHDKHGVYPSPGACDETVHLMYHKKKVTEKELEALSGRKTGLVSEHEHLCLKIVPLELLCQTTPDVKAHSAYALYAYLVARTIIR